MEPERIYVGITQPKRENTDPYKYNQQSLLRIADSFLVQYLATGADSLKESLSFPRLFTIGHSLELYLKSALLDPSGRVDFGHNIPKLLWEFDPVLCLSAEELNACKQFFNVTSSNFDLGLYLKYQDEMELYLAQYFTVNLKYTLDNKHKNIVTTMVAPSAVNRKYLRIINSIRSKIQSKDIHHDECLVSAVNGIISDPSKKNLVINLVLNNDISS